MRTRFHTIAFTRKRQQTQSRFLLDTESGSLVYCQSLAFPGEAGRGRMKGLPRPERGWSFLGLSLGAIGVGGKG